MILNYCSILIFLLLTSNFKKSISLEIQVNELFPDITLYNQVLHDKESNFYNLKEIEVNSKYEVRLSYPAIIPTDFLIEVIDSSKGSTTRSLLNVEQLQFSTNVQRNFMVKVTAHRTGVPLDKARLDDPVYFNIILNRLFLGCSLSTWKMIMSLIVLIGLTIKFMVPRLLTFIENEFYDESVPNHHED